MPDAAADGFLRAAREHVVDEHDARLISPLRDFAGRYGYRLSLGGERVHLAAKATEHRGRLSVSKPALADALEADAYVAVYDASATALRVFDPALVVAEGREHYLTSKQDVEVGVRDIDPDRGVTGAAFCAGERPPAP